MARARGLRRPPHLHLGWQARQNRLAQFAEGARRALHRKWTRSSHSPSPAAMFGRLAIYINARLHGVDRSFTSVDRRFDSLDRRFDDMRDLWRAGLFRGRIA